MSPRGEIYCDDYVVNVFYNCDKKSLIEGVIEMEEKIFGMEHIMLDQPLQSRDQIFTALASKGEELGAAEMEGDILEGILEREAMATTNVGRGVAIPHCKSIKIKKTTLLFIRLQQRVEWEGDEEKVKLVFGILTPSNTANTHLSILSKLAKSLLRDDFVQKLLELDETELVLKEINQTIAVKESYSL